MRALAFVAVLVLSACGSSWDVADADGDGISIAEGDCNEGPDGATIYPGAVEVWYDGIDEDCSGGSDFDRDGDGFDSPLAEGGTDCWDDPTDPPADFLALGDAVQPSAANVHPDADDVAYDGVDADCAGDSDFDADGDGYDSSAHPQRDGSTGDDCYDATDDLVPYDTRCASDGGSLEPADVHPGAQDAVYDGIDADCAGDTDYDADGDGYDRCVECDDTDAAIFPNDAEEVWYNGVDENCDNNDGDQDGDGWYAADYPFEIPADYEAGDCWDDPGSIPDDFEAINGRAQPDAADVHPGATEAWYDAVDEACDGGSDFDQDGDGQDTEDFRDRDLSIGKDCDDTDPAIYQGGVEVWYDGVDEDCDEGDDYDQDGDGYDSDGYGGEDCDDLSDVVSPDATEDCGTAVDDDCDGSFDAKNALSCTTYALDDDRDGYGDPDGATECWCEPHASTHHDVTDTSDCDDSRADVSPADTEVCDGADTDEDCDGLSDDDDPSASSARKTRAWRDADGDGYGDADSSGSLFCDIPSGYTTDHNDCDDGSASINPAGTEVCDGADADEDCDGLSDDDDSSTRDATKTVYYHDNDHDGYGSSSDAGFLYCDAPSAWHTTDHGDCDDTRATVNPAASETCATTYDDDCDGVTNEQDATSCTTWYYDGDADGYGTTTSECWCDASASYSASNDDDCDDARATVSPLATETCATSYDDDCDGGANDVGATGCVTYYYDGDRDEYGSTTSQCTCNPSGFYNVTNDDDCDDLRPIVNPGVANESCSTTFDDDCDGLTNELDATGCTTWYADTDSDGYGTTTSACYCSASGSYTATNADDCDDTRATVSPAATETCATAYDDDCDGGVNDVGATGCTTRYYDGDADGYGTTASSCTCTASGSYTATNADDCDDALSAVSPAGTETCATAYDDDCDGGANDPDATACTTRYYDGDADGYGTTALSCTCDAAGAYTAATSDDCDDGNATVTTAQAWYADADADGYGAGSPTTACTAPAGSAALAGDCDDADAHAYPGAVELCDGVRNDCDTAWTLASEDGVVSHEDPLGSWSDVTFSGTVDLADGSYYVCDGAYTVSLVGVGDTVDLVAFGAGGATLTAATTGLPVLYADGGVVSVEGLTLSGGLGYDDAGTTRGGLVYATDASVTLTGCALTGGEADEGGALYLTGTSAVTLADSLVEADTSLGDGGGAFVDGGTLTCTGDTGSAFYGFRSDVAVAGGAVWLAGTADAVFSATDCDFGAALEANAPDDLAGAGISAAAGLGADATLTCDGADSGGGCP